MSIFKFKLTTQVPLETLESNAKTFGELKKDIINSPLGEKISFERSREIREGLEWIKTVKLIEKNTLTEYGDIDEAILPAGEMIIFFVTPIEHKGGMLPDSIENLHNSDYYEVESVLNEWGYNDLMELGSKINKIYNKDINLRGKRNEVLENILSYFDTYFESKNNQVNISKNNQVDEIINNEEINTFKEYLKKSLDYLVEALELFETFEESNIVISSSELHQKALELQRILNK